MVQNTDCFKSMQFVICDLCNEFLEADGKGKYVANVANRPLQTALRGLHMP